MAEKFLKNVNTNILGIRLLQEHKEREIDPTIAQCWECGMLDPGHSSKCCPNGPPICLKCGSREHRFFDCSIPRWREEMNSQHKQAQYCVPCRPRGDHTSLNHTYCSTRREIIKERARIAREKSKLENEGNKRDLELIKSVFEYSNHEIWPALQTKQQVITSAIISLALMDEAVSPGCFQKSLKKGCEDNGLPVIKYTPGQYTAKEFFNKACGVGSSGATVMQGGIYQNGTQTQGKGGARPRTLKDKKAQNKKQEWLESSDNGVTGTAKRDNKDTPYQIRINTSQITEGTSQNKGEAEGGHAPEILRSTQKSSLDTAGIRSFLNFDDTDIDSSLDPEVNITHLPDSYYNITGIQEAGEWFDMEDKHSETDYSITRTQSQLLDDAVDQFEQGNKELALGILREAGIGLISSNR